MHKSIQLIAGLAGVIHILFFLMEAVLWMNPTVHTAFLVENVVDAELLSVYVKNQGYYNLFLAFGMFAGLFYLRQNEPIGKALITYASLFMVGAAIVLLFTIPEMITGVFIQGTFPILVLLSILGKKLKKSD